MCKRFCLKTALRLGVLLAAPVLMTQAVQAQQMDANQIIQQYPKVQGLAGYVSSWETNLNQQMGRRMTGILPDCSQEEPVILYENRMGQQTDQQGFINEIKRGLSNSL